MILLDTDVLVYAFEPDSLHHDWATETIAAAVAEGGAAINAVSLAELCVGDADPPTVADRVRSWGVEILDVPTAAANVCAEAYRRYRKRRKSQSGSPAPAMPLPDFFIGAQAKIMGWSLATADQGRFHTYFPSVRLETPRTVSTAARGQRVPSTSETVVRLYCPVFPVVRAFLPALLPTEKPADPAPACR